MLLEPKRNHMRSETVCVDKVCEASLVNPIIFQEDHLAPADSGKVGFYMNSRLVYVSSSYNSLMLKNMLNWYDKFSLAVLHSDGLVVGVITREKLNREPESLAGVSAASMAIPWNEVTTVDIADPVELAAARFTEGAAFLIVMRRNLPCGILHPGDIPESEGLNGRKTGLRTKEKSISGIMNCFPEGLVVLDRHLTIVYHNKKVMDILFNSKRGIRGKNFELVFGGLFAENHRDFLDTAPIHKVRETLAAVHDLELKTVTGRTYLVNMHPIVQKEKLKCIIVSFRDITDRKIQESEAQGAYADLTEAFKLMLPSTEIEERLRAIPEYRDYFDHNTGLVEIIEVIPDGAYRHVLNCLKIASELYEKGIFSFPEIDRNTVVQALVTHDVGKIQPKLEVGDIIDPSACFADGKVHAMESAGIIAEYSTVSQDVINLVKYHHHTEDELPPDFPRSLMPMLRLVKLVDGLSAGLTRKHAELSLAVEGPRITVYEKNANPHYNGIQEIDLISGDLLFHRL